jgi:hypothetical protein
MNALLETIAPPLVVELNRGWYAWIHRGIGHTLCAATGQWAPLVDAVGIGGRVLTTSQVVALVAAYGRPS